jgi:hypothetical protein
MARAARRSSASPRSARRRGAIPALRNADTNPLSPIGMDRNQDAYWVAVRAAMTDCPPLCSSQRVLLRMIFAVPFTNECQYLTTRGVSSDAA